MFTEAGFNVTSDMWLFTHRGVCLGRSAAANQKASHTRAAPGHVDPAHTVSDHTESPAAAALGSRPVRRDPTDLPTENSTAKPNTFTYIYIHTYIL